MNLYCACDLLSFAVQGNSVFPVYNSAIVTLNKKLKYNNNNIYTLLTSNHYM